MALTDYIIKKGGRRELASIEDSDYIEKSGGGLITATRNDTDNTKANRMTITKKQIWEEKQLYGRFKRLINNISQKKPGRGLEKRLNLSKYQHKPMP